MNHSVKGIDDDRSRRILIISPNWIGDAVIAQPLLQRLRQQDPECAIDVLAPGWVAPVWRAMPEVRSVLEAPFRHGKLQLRERWQYAQQLRRSRYQRAYVLPNTFKFALIPWLAGIPVRVGYRGEMRYGLLNVVHHVEKDAPRPMVSFYAALADAPTRAAPAPDALPKPRLAAPSSKQSEVLAKFGLSEKQALIAFAPGAEFGSAKRWPGSHFAELAAIVRRHHPAAQIVLLGSPKEKQVCDEIAAVQPHVRNLAGSTNLDEAIAVLAQADAVVSNDSGLMNIASALNRPIVTMYGPTDYRNTPPFSDQARVMTLNLSCAPCKQRECPLGHHDCMRKLSPEMVWNALQPMLTRS